jgi:hypothetical protein
VHVCVVLSNEAVDFDNEGADAFEKLKDKIVLKLWPQEELRKKMCDQFLRFRKATDNVRSRLECQCTSGFYDAEPAVPVKLEELLKRMWDLDPAHRPDSEDVYTDICEMAQMESNPRPSSL